MGQSQGSHGSLAFPSLPRTFSLGTLKSPGPRTQEEILLRDGEALPFIARLKELWQNFLQTKEPGIV